MDATRVTLDAALRQRLRETISAARRREAGVQLDSDRPSPIELLALRRSSGLSVTEVATRMGAYVTTVSRIEGRTGTNTSTVSRAVVDQYLAIVYEAIEGLSPPQREEVSLRELTRWRYELELARRIARREELTADAG